MPNVDDSDVMILAATLALAAGLEITEQDRALELANDARVYIGAGCTVLEATVAMRQTWHRGERRAN